MKIAIVGGGIFGCVGAIKLSQFHQVTLFERNSGILHEASGINQYRLHRGYHYPRSPETVEQSLRAFRKFDREYHDCTIIKNEHRYCIATNDSKVSREEYLDFLRSNRLYYEIDYSNCVNNCQLIVNNCDEYLIDIASFKMKLVKQLRESGVEVKTSTTFEKSQIDDFDLVVNCTYSNLNSLLDESEQIDYQFEICEKPIVRLGEKYKNKSYVILDGDFCCIDPLEYRDEHVMGHVKHAIYHTNVGKFPEIPEQFKPLLNIGRIKNPPITNFGRFVQSGKEFFIDFDPVHVGSMFTIRTVLPNKHETDERPTYITKHNGKLYSIFSGKIVTCVAIANELCQMLK